MLFDRNNHKSLHQGALVQAGAIPVFLPTARNPFGMIGAVDWDAWDENYLREQIRANPLVKDPNAAQGGAALPARLHPARDLRRHGLQRREGAGEDRPPVRLRALGRGVDRLQRLPSAVRGITARCGSRISAPDMPGLFSTQSVHKQGAGFSQASQIHKRDEHIKGQKRFIEHKRFNESFLMHASTSPFYPLFASLDVNAKVHEGKAGEMLWDRCIELGIEARKKLREFGRHYAKTGASAQEQWFFDPFVPDVVTIRGSKFTKDVDQRRRGKSCRPRSSSASSSAGTSTRRATWHGYQGYADGYAMVDPNKLMLLTPGIDRKTGDYLDFGVPATVRRELPARAAHRAGEVRPQQHPVPDDAGRGREQAQHADRQAGQVQEPLGSRRAARRGPADALRAATASATPATRSARSATRCTTSIAQANIKELQRRCFRASSFPELAMSPKDAYEALVANDVDYVPLDGASRAASPRRSR